MRKLKNGVVVKELNHPIDLIIHTKCPSKWLLIDMETGQQYVGLEKPDQYGMWKRIKE